MGKRGNGEGSINLRKDGRWCARYTVQTPSGPKRKTIYGKTRQEVSQKLAKAMADRDRGLVVDAGSLRVDDYLDRWLDSVRNTVKDRTWQRHEEVVRLHLNPALGKVRLDRLSPLQVQSLYRAKLDSGLSPRTVRVIHMTLHKALKQAVRWQLVPHNITEAVDPPRPTKREIRPLNPEQVKVLLDAAKETNLYALYLLAVTTGMRRGELLGLKWEDLDLQAGTLQVRRSLSVTRGGLMFVSPKSAKGYRSITITSEAIKALKTHRARQEKQRLRKKGYWADNDLVFPSTVGTPIYPNRWSERNFKKLLRRANLHEIRFHDLRHTCATLLLSKGIHPKIVQEMLGHSNISITLDTYSHVLPNMQKEAAKAMEDILD